MTGPTAADLVEAGRQAFADRRWTDAYEALSAADRQTPLGPEDLELLAEAFHLTGRVGEGSDFRARAHQEYLAKGDVPRAVRCAFWQGMHLMQRGEMAPAMGWFTRGQRELDESGADCVERGYMRLPLALQSLFGGDPAAAHENFEEIATIAGRFGDPDVKALSDLGRGQSLVALGRTAEGVRMLDEAMTAITAGEVSPIVTGIVYCAVIEACHECLDIRRAREWTVALSHWCDSQPDLVPFRGQCLVHRAQIMQFSGAWPDALTEARRAREWLTEITPNPAVGLAHYVLGELHRLRGNLDEAEESYREANRCGHAPQPGLALLRLAQGQADAAAVTIRRLTEEAARPNDRAQLLPAAVEIFLAARDVAAARAAADELANVAAVVDVALVRAAAEHATGAVLLAEGDARAAVEPLRRAGDAWRELEAPYEGARVRVLMARALRALGDEDAAALEADAALSTLAELGAVLPPAEAGAPTVPSAAPGGLTPREVEVLRLVASGKTNRAVAQELVLSEKTVERHLSNIFAKLGVSSRSAATAYAYEHDLVHRG